MCTCMYILTYIRVYPLCVLGQESVQCAEAANASLVEELQSLKGVMKEREDLSQQLQQTKTELAASQQQLLEAQAREPPFFSSLPLPPSLLASLPPSFPPSFSPSLFLFPSLL